MVAVIAARTRSPTWLLVAAGGLSPDLLRSLPMSHPACRSLGSVGEYGAKVLLLACCYQSSELIRQTLNENADAQENHLAGVVVPFEWIGRSDRGDRLG